MKPDLIEWNIGDNAHGQPIKLRQYRETGGRIVFSITQEPANQRDDSNRVGGLTDAQLRQIGNIVANL